MNNYKIPTYLLTLCLLITTGLTSNASNNGLKYTNESIGQASSNIKVSDPVAYFSNRVKALKLVRQEKWKQAQSLLKKLTQEFPDDGDTWYMLGLANMQLEQWQSAINALEKTINLGTILSGIPTGSSPSNDTMIKIAQAYAQLGNEDLSLLWINKSLEARYDDRKNLIGSSKFGGIVNSENFKKASGSYMPKGLTRSQSWQFDLDFLVREIKRLHVNLYHRVSELEFAQKVENISKKIPQLKDKEIVFEFMQLVASIGNGHNFIVPAYSKKGAFNQLLFQFYWFNDGLYIVKTEPNNNQYLGRKVIAIGHTPIEQAFEKSKSINARDNEMQQLWLSPYYLSLPSVLKGLGIVDDADQIELTLEDRTGATQVIKAKQKTLNFNGFPKLPPLADSDAIHNLKADKVYWYENLPKKSTVYMQYNYVRNSKAQSFEEFNLELREQLTKNSTDHLIIDLRHNAGGDGSSYPPLLKTLVQFEANKPNGKVFVIIGRNTFSAAHNLLLDIEKLTNAIIVGEPSGSRPNAMSEAGWFKLPYSGTWGIISSQFHQKSKAEDHRIWVAPQIPVTVSSKAYFSAQDPALKAIFKLISQVKSSKL